MFHSLLFYSWYKFPPIAQNLGRIVIMQVSITFAEQIAKTILPDLANLFKFIYLSMVIRMLMEQRTSSALR
jgi:hypothetical protein